MGIGKMQDLYILVWWINGHAQRHRSFIAGEENAKQFYFDTIKDGDCAELYDTTINEVGLVEPGTKLLG